MVNRMNQGKVMQTIKTSYCTNKSADMHAHETTSSPSSVCSSIRMVQCATRDPRIGQACNRTHTHTITFRQIKLTTNPITEDVLHAPDDGQITHHFTQAHFPTGNNITFPTRHHTSTHHTWNPNPPQTTPLSKRRIAERRGWPDYA